MCASITQERRTLWSARSLKRCVSWCGNWTERHGHILFVLLVMIYVCAALGYSLVMPLWHDELFTFNIAQAPTLHDLLFETKTLDLNPPLSYLLTRATYHVFNVGTLQCRAPEIAGFALAMTGVFAFARRRAGNAYGLLSAGLLLSSSAGRLSFQARPYGLFLGFTALALAFWQRSCDLLPGTKRANLMNVLLFLSLVALLMTHVFGVLAWLSILIGELTFAYIRRRVDVPRLLASVLPIRIIAAYGPLVRNHSSSAFPSAFQPTLRTVAQFYKTELSSLLISVLCAALFGAVISKGSWLRRNARFVLTPQECVALCGLALIPFILIVHLWLHHGAFFDRYGVAANVGFAILLSIFLCWLAGGRPAVATIALVAALLFSGRLPDAITSLKHFMVFRATEPSTPTYDLESRTDPGLPIVDASGLTFVEMNHSAPANLLARVYYLDDPAAALQFAHATIFNGMALEAARFNFQGRVASYTNFVAEHPRFYVVGTYAYPEEWLLRKLQADGMQLRFLGLTHVYSRDQELYEVSHSIVRR